MATNVELLTGLVNVAIPEVYQKGMSYYEVLTAVVNKVNELIEQSNEYFNKDLKQYTKEILIGWKDDGTLDTLIADAVLDIGDRQYTEQNYVTDGETITASIDALDITTGSNLENIEQRSKNLYHLGVIPDDPTKATENTILLNSLFAIEGQVYFAPPGNIYFDDTLLFAKNVTLYGTDRSFFVLTANEDAFNIKSRCNIQDIKITLPAVHTESGIVVDGSNQVRNYKLTNIRIEVSNVTSKGIKLIASGAGNYVVFGLLSKIQVTGGLYAIYIEDTQDTGDVGYVNGNQFSDLILYGNYGIYLKGRPSGNRFDFQYQSGITTIAGVYCEGYNNTFNGFIWDIAHAPGAKTFIFDWTSKNNIAIFPAGNVITGYYTDMGLDNKIIGKERDYFPQNVAYDYDIYNDKSRKNKPYYMGNQDNCLAYIDKIGSVTVTGTKSGAWLDYILFDPKLLALSGIFTDPSVTPIVIEIDMGSSPINRMYMVGLSFFRGHAPDSYKLEIVTTSGGSYTTLADVTGNVKSTIMHGIGTYGQDIYKIKLTITKAIESATFNPSNLIEMRGMFGGNLGIYKTGAYVLKGGDMMYSNLRFNSRSGIVLQSPDGTNYLIRIANGGTLTFTVL